MQNMCFQKNTRKNIIMFIEWIEKLFNRTYIRLVRARNRKIEKKNVYQHFGLFIFHIHILYIKHTNLDLFINVK